MTKLFLYLVPLLTLLPSLTSAAGVQAPENFAQLVTLLTSIIGKLVLLVLALTFLAFMWGVLKAWVINGGNSEGIDDGKNVVMAGIIGFVVLASFWGILYMLQKTLGG